VYFGSGCRFCNYLHYFYFVFLYVVFFCECDSVYGYVFFLKSSFVSLSFSFFVFRFFSNASSILFFWKYSKR